MSPLGSIATRSGFDRNPMRRTTDRVEAWISLALIFLFAALTPAVSWYAWHTAYQMGMRVERAQQIERHRTSARLLTPASYQRTTIAQGPFVMASMAEWKGADGTPRTGVLLVNPGARAQSVQPIWTDDAGRIVGRPQRHSATVADAALAAGVTAIVLTSVLGAIRILVRRRLDRHRLDQWQSEWQRIGPAWCHPR
jgi:hypothetical protein